MEYPGSWFTKIYRRTFFALFLVLFFVLSPLIIMYALGYRYDVQNGLLRETSAISVDIEPENTTTYLNELEVDNVMPVRLKIITPGKYHLRLSASGYYNFDKEINARSKQTVYIKEISLLQKNEPTKISSEQVLVMSISPNGAYLVYARPENDSYQISLLTIADNTVQKLSVPISGTPQISWSENSAYFLINAKEAPFESLWVLATSDPQAPWLVQPKNGPIAKAIWQNGSEPEIILGTETEILNARPIQKTITVIARNNFIDWYAENQKIWTIEKRTTDNKIYLIKDALGFSEKFAEIKIESGQKSEELKILQTKNDVALLQNKPGQILIVANAKQSTVNADNFMVSPFNNWWLFWTPWELTTYSAGEEPYLQTRSGEGLRAVWPLDNFNTLGLVWGGRVEALFPYYSVGHNLLNSATDITAVDSQNKILYFSGKINDASGIWKLKY